MATVKCPDCKTDYQIDGPTQCPVDFILLDPSMSDVEQPRTEPAEEDATEADCERCGNEPATAGRRLCSFCDNLAPHGRMTLVFAGERLEVPGELNLGRQPSFSPLAEQLADFLDVSREHARVEGPDHPAIHDNYSSFGTFVNDVRLPPGETTPLRHGDRVRLARRCVFDVELGL